MNVLRTTVVLLTLVGSSFVVASPATAGGVPANGNCWASNLVERCAYMSPAKDREVDAWGSTKALNERVLSKVVRTSLQHKTANGWRSVVVHKPDSGWKRGSVYIGAYRLCERAAPGKYRSKAFMKWKEGRNGFVYSAGITSGAIRKSRVCG